MAGRALAAGLIATLALTALATLAGADGLLFDPQFREPEPGDRLVDGDPPLHRRDLDAFVDLFETAFDLALPADREQALRDAWETSFAAGSPDARRQWLAMVTPLPEMKRAAAAGEDEAVRRGLRAFRGLLDERLRERPSHTAHRLVQAALERRHEVVWEGSPPVKGGAVDAYLAIARFVASLARNEKVEPTAGQREALVTDLSAAVRAKDTPVRERLARVHHLWLRAEARWDLDEGGQRFRMRWAAVELAAELLPPAARFEPTLGTTLADYAREARRIARAQPAFDTLTNLARNPEALLDVLERGLRLEERRERPEPAFMLRERR